MINLYSNNIYGNPLCRRANFLCRCAKYGLMVLQMEIMNQKQSSRRSGAKRKEDAESP